MPVQILTGDCREIIKTLPENSVHCVVTSPPYWGLRDYGTAKWEGGDAGCDHVATSLKPSAKSTLQDHGEDGRSPYLDSLKGIPYRNACGKCGATRIDSQLGLEQTPAEYVEQMVQVFREVRRVLRKDGTLWLNLGDSYAGGGTIGRNDDESMPRPKGGHRIGTSSPGNQGKRPSADNLKPKDLCGIPWMVAFALRADGWWLRQDIIWAKPNPMPESVTDRCTKAHEYLFLLTKSASYYYDAAAIAEPSIYAGEVKDYTGDQKNNTVDPKMQATRPKGREIVVTDTRNKRSVWTVTTQPFAEAHFATFPPALIEPCILAGCPKDGTVLDPFGGAGTTGLVADRQQRNAILIELNPTYAEMAKKRIYNDAPLFAEVS